MRLGTPDPSKKKGLCMEKNYVAPEVVEAIRIQIAEHNGYKSWEEFQKVLLAEYNAKRKAWPLKKKVKFTFYGWVNRVLEPLGWYWY